MFRFQVTCPECGGPIDAGGRGRESVCASCGWPGGRESTEDESPIPLAGELRKQSVRKPPVRKRKKRRPPTDDLPAQRRVRLSAFAVSAGFLLMLWALLWWLSIGTRSGPYWLLLCGILTTATAVMWLYRSAFADGVEHLNFLTHNSPILTVRVLLFLCELVFVPFFSVVYLILFFHNAWKPFLIEILGIGMSVTGVVLALG